MITSEQIRAGRALLRWSARDLAERTGVHLNTIQRMESADGVPSASGKNLEAVERALGAAGIIFIAENGDGPGVRLRKGAQPPKLRALPYKAAPGFYVEVIWPNGRRQEAGEFATEDEAQHWIEHESAGWIARHPESGGAAS